MSEIEELRAQVAALTAERDAAVNVRNEALRDCNAALARAEAAEARITAALDAMAMLETGVPEVVERRKRDLAPIRAALRAPGEPPREGGE